MAYFGPPPPPEHTLRHPSFGPTGDGLWGTDPGSLCHGLQTSVPSFLDTVTFTGPICGFNQRDSPSVCFYPGGEPTWPLQAWSMSLSCGGPW